MVRDQTTTVESPIAKMVIAEIVRFSTGAQGDDGLLQPPVKPTSFFKLIHTVTVNNISNIYERSFEKPWTHQRVPKPRIYHPESIARASIVLPGPATSLINLKPIRDTKHRSPITMPLIMVRYRPLFLPRAKALPGS
jgi:hypothetical protein